MNPNLKKFYDAAQAAETRVQQIAQRINELFEGGLNDEALKLRPDLDAARIAAKEAQQLYLSMVDATQGNGDMGQRFVPVASGYRDGSDETTDLRSAPEYMSEWHDALRVGATPTSIAAGQHNPERYGRLMAALTETGGTPAGSEGGFLNPIDFDNMIHERMRQFIDLAVPEYFNIEDVTTYSGWRSIETKTAEQPFDQLTELETLGDDDETESPTFIKVEFTLADYGGFLRVSNSLLADTTTNLMRYISRWFGKKAVLTNNSIILAIINALTPTAITDVKNLLPGIKTVLNKVLDPAIAARATIFTNQSGFDLLDQLVDGTSRPLLQPDPTNASLLRLLGREVVRLSNAHWGNLISPDRARIAIGAGDEFLTFFRRAAMEMSSTNIGGSAWRSNSTEVRGIMRADAAQVDANAMALLTVTLPS